MIFPCQLNFVDIKNRLLGITDAFYLDDTKNWVLTTFWNSLYLAFLLLPLDINLPTPFFIISIILGVINIVKEFPQRKIVENRAIFLFPLYFMVMSASLFYSDNFKEGINLLQRSLSLLLFPIVFLFVKEDASAVRKLFSFLLFGLLISFFINLGIVIFDTFNFVDIYRTFASSEFEIKKIINISERGLEYCIGSEFSKLVNPSYVSMYILLVLSYHLKKELTSFRQFLTILILFIYLFLLASKAAYLILGMMSILLIWSIKERNKKYLTSVIFILGIIVFIKHPRVSDAYKNIEGVAFSNFEYTNSTSQEARFLSWKTSVELIREAPLLGYGIGDANEILINKYKELGYDYNYQNKYNAHNQFFQTLLQTGIVGFIVLLGVFIILLTRLLRSRNELSVFLILFISLLFESMWVRFNGIVFFSVIVPLLLKKRSILSSRIIRNERLLRK